MGRCQPGLPGLRGAYRPPEFEGTNVGVLVYLCTRGYRYIGPVRKVGTIHEALGVEQSAVKHEFLWGFSDFGPAPSGE